MISERDLRLAKAIVDPYIGQDIIATAVLGTKLGSMLNENAYREVVTSLDEKKNATLNNALLKASTRIRLISKRELEDVAKITLDGELVEWRQGGELVNGVKFFSQELLYFSNGRSASITERACKISQFIKNANPELPDEIIAGWMGLPPTVLETMKRDQLRNDQVSEQDD